MSIKLKPCSRCGKEFDDDDPNVYSFKDDLYYHKACMTEEDYINKLVLDEVELSIKHVDYNEYCVYNLSIWTKKGFDFNDWLHSLLIAKGVYQYDSNYLPVKITIEFLEKEEQT